MRKETLFKIFYDEASRLAEEMDTEIALPHPRKASMQLNEKHDNQYFITSNEKLNFMKMADEAKLTNIDTSFSSDPTALKREWALLI